MYLFRTPQGSEQIHFFYKTGGFYQNMIWKVSARPGEMQFVELTTGTDDILLYNWKADQAYHYVRLDLSYCEGGYPVGETITDYMEMDQTGRDHRGKLVLQFMDEQRETIHYALSYEGGSFSGPMELREASYYEKTGGQVTEITAEGAGKSRISEGIPLTIGKWQFADEDGGKIGEIVVEATFLKEKPEGI